MVRNLPSPFDLQYFVEVAHSLNISRAAERLGISQPSLSLAIKRLEDALGSELLIRQKGGVQLSRTGQKFVVHARKLLEEWENITKESFRGETQVTGRFSIGCHPSVALYTLPGFLPQILVDHEELEIQLTHGLSRQVTDDVINFKVDFGIVVNPVAHPDLVLKSLAKDEVTLFASQSYFKKWKDGKLRESERVLIYDPDLIQSQSLLKAIKKKNMEFGRTVTSSSLEVIASLTEQDVGIGVLPGRVAAAATKQSKPLVVLPQAPKFQDQICMIYRADAQKAAASKVIIAAIQKCLV